MRMNNMNNIIDNLPMYAHWYVFNLPCYLYHEICHWVFGVLFFVVGLISFPKLVIERLPVWKVNHDRSGFDISTAKMYVSYTNHNGYSWINRVIAIAPIVGVIVLFVISPWYLYIYYISQIDCLCLSIKDREMVFGSNNDISN